MKICCIDFETANTQRASACSVGIAMIEDGVITQNIEQLIKPHVSCNYFAAYNMQIHGITAKDVANSPDFRELYPWLMELLNVDFVVAHNAAFDISVLRNLCNLYNLDYPIMKYFCTLKAAPLVWGELKNHKLDTICEHLGHTFQHHNAKEDAKAAALITLEMLKLNSTDSLSELADKLSISLGVLTLKNYKPCGMKK